MGTHSALDVGAVVRRLALLGVCLVVLIAASTAAFALVEGISAWRAFVWTLDTVATIGSMGDPEDTGGQVVKVVLIVLGVGTLFYALVTLTELVVAGHLSGLLRERRVRRMIDELRDHYVICGFGRVGRQVARDLRAAGVHFVVLDSNTRMRQYADEMDVLMIDGQPSEDAVLRAAGIERARGLVACVDSDADNVFITLTARSLCPDLMIVARAAEEETEPKLRAAGADRVISPYKSSGHEMARLALHPQVSGALQVAEDFLLEEIAVLPGCEAAGRRLGEVRGGTIIAALRKDDGRVAPEPPADTVLQVGDTVVALGTRSALERLESLFQPEGVPAP